MLEHKRNKNSKRSSLTQLGVWPLEGVCHAPHSHPSSNEEQNSERSDSGATKSLRIKRSVMSRITWEIPRTFANRVPLFNLIVITSLVCCFVCASTLVHRTPPNEHGFRPRARLWRPLFSGTTHLCPRPKPCWVRWVCSWCVIYLHGASSSRNLNFTMVQAFTLWYQLV